MKKNIVVLVNEIANDYSFSVIDGITSFFKDKDVNLIIIPTRMGQNLFCTHYWAGMKLASLEQIDGVIVLSAIYLSSITKEQLTTYLSELKTDNIVSISSELPLQNSVCTMVSCKKAYTEIISHLCKEHGCKRFAFMSANNTGSEEAFERYHAFREALEANNIEFDENLIFEGSFVFDKAMFALNERYKKAEDVDFDAIIAANDIMAYGAITVLDNLGLKTPDDIKVVGFDDIVLAQTAELSLTTINQQMTVQGKTAAELAWKKANGENIPKKTLIDTKPIYRKSCGCNDNQSDFMEKLKKSFSGQNVSVALQLEKNMIQQSIYYLLDSLQTEITLEKLLETFESILPQQYISNLTVCLYDEPLHLYENKNFSLSKKAAVKLFLDKQENISLININDSFDLSKKMLPDKYFGSTSGTFMFQPIFFGHKQYGYIVCKCATDSYLLTMIYLKTFSSILSQAYIFTKQMEENAKLMTEKALLEMDNSELNEASMLDSLTHLFNRRGLMKTGQEAINLSLKMGTTGVVFFADMDFLKEYNDTYGHETGDLALITLAEVFKTVFRQNDVISRIGGDEYAGVLPGLPYEYVPKIISQIEAASKELSEKNKLPFPVQVSFGTVEFTTDCSDLEELLKLADKVQYEIKRSHHSERK